MKNWCWFLAPRTCFPGFLDDAEQEKQMKGKVWRPWFSFPLEGWRARRRHLPPTQSPTSAEEEESSLGGSPPPRKGSREGSNLAWGMFHGCPLLAADIFNFHYRIMIGKGQCYLFAHRPLLCGWMTVCGLGDVFSHQIVYNISAAVWGPWWSWFFPAASWQNDEMEELPLKLSQWWRSLIGSRLCIHESPLIASIPGSRSQSSKRWTIFYQSWSKDLLEPVSYSARLFVRVMHIIYMFILNVHIKCI